MSIKVFDFNIERFNQMNLKKLWTSIFLFVVFLIPTNLFYKFYLSESYVNSLQVDYLIPKIYILDLFIIFFIFCSFIFKKFLNIETINKNLFLKITPFFLIIIFAVDFSYLNSLLTFLRFAIYFIFAIIVYKNRVELLNEKFYFVFNLTVIFQFILSIYQYFFQKSFYGFLFFGESNLNNFYGIAKTNFFDDSRILPYGTTPHPNILAGFMSIFFIINLIKKEKNTLDYLSIFLSLVTIFLTESLSAVLTIFIATLIYLCKNIFAKISIKNNLLIFFSVSILSIILLNIFSQKIDSQSLSRRNYLNQAAIKIIIDQPFTGTKINNFTRFVEKYSNNSEIVRFVQPVHNVLLLILAELGIFMTALIIIYFCFFVIKFKFDEKLETKNAIYLLAILPIINLDHYLYTIPTGSLSLILLLILLFENKS